MSNELFAISPVDGRYASKTNELSPFFSEAALIKYRVIVEVKYLIDFVPYIKNEKLSDATIEKLNAIVSGFGAEDALRIKEIEATTNHDVKAVEYFLREKLEANGEGDLIEWIHFGLTSQDINNTAIPLSIKEAIHQVYLPLLDELIDTLSQQANDWKEIPLLARTHGQPASPTKLGKEIWVFVERLKIQRTQLLNVPISAKFGGATGNFNAHHIAYPQLDWINFGNQFVNESLGLNRSQTTTQIEHYDNLAALFQNMARINTIIIDLNRDMWQYISQEYFKQKIKKGEVGSSAMPHKVNPIDFENSEGNLGIANALLEHLAAKLPISRLQRDLTDSTVLRNVGMPFAYALISFKATLKGLGKVLLNEQKFHDDLEQNWAVVAEAIQTILRRESYPHPYEALKQLTRTNTVIDKAAMHTFIEGLNVSAEIKSEMKAITPQNYTGVNLF